MLCIIYPIYTRCMLYAICNHEMCDVISVTYGNCNMTYVGPLPLGRKSRLLLVWVLEQSRQRDRVYCIVTRAVNNIAQKWIHALSAEYLKLNPFHPTKIQWHWRYNVLYRALLNTDIVKYQILINIDNICMWIGSPNPCLRCFRLVAGAFSVC